MSALNSLEKERKLLTLLKERDELQNAKMSYGEASKTDVAAEVARSVGRGAGYAGEFFGDIYDIGRAAVDEYIPGAEDRKVIDQINPFAPPDGGDKAREQFVEDTGLVKLGEEKIRRGDNATLDAAKTASEYIIPVLTGGPQGGAKQALRNVATTGGGAALGEAAGGEVGEVIGALTGGIASRAVATKVKNMFGKYFNAKEVSDDVIKRAVAAIMQQADDPAAAQARLKQSILNGDEGTLADLMGDAGVYNVEALASKGSTAAHARDAAQRARDAQIESRLGAGFGAGDSAQVSPLAKARQEAARARVDAASRRRLNTARAEANTGLVQSRAAQQTADQTLDTVQRANAREVNRVGNFEPVSYESKRLATTLDDADNAAYQQNVQPPWAQFDAAPDIATGGLPTVVDNLLQAIPDVQRRGIATAFKQELDTLNNLGPSASPKEIHAVISSIKGKLANVDEAKPFQREMVRINKQLETFLESSPAGRLYERARDATAQHTQTFKPGGLGKARRQTKDGELLASKLALDLEKGAVTADQILGTGTPAIRQSFGDTVRAMATRAEQAGGLDAFLRKHSELLSRFPALEADLRGLSRSNAGLAAQAKTTASINKAEDAAQKTIAVGLNKAREKTQAIAKTGDVKLRARLLNDLATKPNTTIDRILKAEDGPRQIEKLLRDVGKTPAARENFKALLGDRFTAGMRRKDGIIDPSAKAQFDKMRPVLEADGIMSVDELNVIADVLDMTSSTGMRRQAAAVRNETLDKQSRLMASAFAAASMKVLPGNSLILAGAARQWFKDQMLRSPDPDIILVLETMMKNPRRFEQAIAEYKPATAADVKSMMTAIVKDLRDATTGTAIPPAMVQSGNEQTYSRE